MSKAIKLVDKADLEVCQAFEEFTNTVRIGFKPSQLTGKGTEYLVANGVVIARFFNGDLIQSLQAGNKDDTKGVV